MVKVAPPDHALGGQAPAHRLDQPLGQGQAHAGALDLGLLDPEAVERLEQPGHLVGRDAVAVVGDHDRHPALGRRPAGDADVAPMAAVLDGVGGQVQQHLLEPLVVGLDGPAAVARRRGLDGDPAFGGQRPDQVDGVLDDLEHVHRLGRERQAAGLDSGDVQDLVDQAEQVPPAAQDVVDALGLLLAELLELEQLPEAEDGVQRGPQLVAHLGEEVTLGPVGPVGVPLGLLQVLQDLPGPFLALLQLLLGPGPLPQRPGQQGRSEFIDALRSSPAAGRSSPWRLRSMKRRRIRRDRHGHQGAPDLQGRQRRP
jgi:hypothetical protein